MESLRIGIKAVKELEQHHCHYHIITLFTSSQCIKVEQIEIWIEKYSK